ncbi:MAG: helicase [Gammaproteobacteria bacterium]|nr:MAG: helicase [Gammaproteobacteria bacterium]
MIKPNGNIEHMNYHQFIKTKERNIQPSGFSDDVSGYGLFDFQEHLTSWALEQGKSAIFADCGLGKTPMQLVWADRIARKFGKVLIVSPLAVSDQTVREAKKFGIDGVKRSKNGDTYRITVTNYERLHYFSPDEFSGIVCDESSILKNYAGKTRQAITDFMQKIPYRLLCTATPAPNDYMELGTSCEALSIMRRVEMLAMYFIHNSGSTQAWDLKGHAADVFWRFMALWSRAMRKPSDLGFDDGDFILPELKHNLITVKSKPLHGDLFPVEALTLNDQRAERRSTLDDRCKAVADIANSNDDSFLAWCSLNAESDCLTKYINGAVSVSGSDSDDEKERKMMEFSDGTIRCLVTKPKISGFGLNWQHCNQMSFFPSHSHEQYYQAVRRCWRFGQENDVTVNIVTSEGEIAVLENMRRKEVAANAMFDSIIKHMTNAIKNIDNTYKPNRKMEIPAWLNV